MNRYIRTYIYSCIHVYTQRDRYVDVHICVLMYEFQRTDKTKLPTVYTAHIPYVHTYVRTYICTGTYMAYMYSTYVCTRVCVWSHNRHCMCDVVRSLVRKYGIEHNMICTYVCTYFMSIHFLKPSISKCTHTHAHTRTHAHTHARTHTHYYVRTYIHTILHTYMYVCTIIII